MNATRTLRVRGTEQAMPAMRPENSYPNVHVPTTAARHKLSTTALGRPQEESLQVRVDAGKHHRASDGKMIKWTKPPTLALNVAIEFRDGEATIFIGRIGGAMARKLGLSSDVPGVVLVSDAGIVRELVQGSIDQARAEIAIMESMGNDARHISAKATAIRLTRQLALGENLSSGETDGLTDLVSTSSHATHAILFSDCELFAGLSKLAGVIRISRARDIYEALRFGVVPKTVQNHAYGRDDTFTLADSAILRISDSAKTDVSLPSPGDWDEEPVTQVVRTSDAPARITREVPSIDLGIIDKELDGAFVDDPSMDWNPNAAKDPKERRFKSIREVIADAAHKVDEVAAEDRARGIDWGAVPPGQTMRMIRLFEESERAQATA